VTGDFALQRCGLCIAAVWSLHYSTVGFAVQHLGLHCSSDKNGSEASGVRAAAKYHHMCEVVFYPGANADFFNE
jgi:hypothetical protein